MLIVDKFNKKKKPKKIEIIIENIPKELKESKTWVCWSWYWDNNKWTKPPVTPEGFNLNHLKSEFTFDECLAAYKKDKSIAGIGISLRSEDKNCGIDFDDCFDDKGKQTKRFKKALKLLNGAYIEKSPGGKGARVFGIGNPKTRGSSKNAREIEIYNSGRYLTVTGHQIGTSKVLTNIEKACKKIDKKIYKKQEQKQKSNTNIKNLSNHEFSDPKLMELRLFLKTLEKDQDDRDTWYTTGMVIHYETRGSLAGFQMWDGWARMSTANNYDEETSWNTWNSFKKKSKSENPLTIASFHYEENQRRLNQEGFTITNYKAIQKDKTPPPENILDPWFMKGSINMLHAKRGLGKTHFSIGLALALAAGNKFLKWKAKKAKRVLYIDGEMPFVLLKQYLEIQKSALTGNLPKANMLNFITIDKQNEGVFPSLSEEEGRNMVEQAIALKKPEVIIFDSLFTCFKINEYAGDYWSEIQDWLIKLRSRGIDILLVHHDNKSGKAQSGRVDKEHVLNTILHLKEPDGIKKGKAARFEIEFSKNRHFFGDDAKNFEARLIPNDKGGSSWSVVSSGMTTRERIAEYTKDGNNPADIAVALNMSKANVAYHIKKCLETGLLEETDITWKRRKRGGTK